MVLFDYERWLFLKGSNNRALTGIILALWIVVGCLWEGVANGSSKTLGLAKF